MAGGVDPSGGGQPTPESLEEAKKNSDEYTAAFKEYSEGQRINAGINFVETKNTQDTTAIFEKALQARIA